MTYNELQHFLNTLSEEQMNCHIAIYCLERDEFYPVFACRTTEECDVLDEDHPYLELKVGSPW